MDTLQVFSHEKRRRNCRREKHQHRYVEHADNVDKGIARLHVAQQIDRIIRTGDIGHHGPEEGDAHGAQVFPFFEGTDQQIEQIELLPALLIRIFPHPRQQR